MDPRRSERIVKLDLRRTRWSGTVISTETHQPPEHTMHTTPQILENVAGRFLKPAPIAARLGFVVSLPEYEYRPVGAFHHAADARDFAAKYSMPLAHGAATVTNVDTGGIVAEYRDGERV